MSALAIEAGEWEIGSSGPVQFAKRLATYISNPERIRLLTVREYGVTLSPSVKRCEEYRAAYERSHAAYRERSASADEPPDNDNGDPYKVRGLVKPSKPPRVVTIEPPTVIREPKTDARLKVLERERERHAAIRRKRIAQAGPIARGIIESVAEFYLLTPHDLIGHARQSYVVGARMVAARLLSEVLDSKGKRRFSATQIGRLLGGREHTTVLHMLAVFEKRAAKYPLMAEAYEALRNA